MSFPPHPAGLVLPFAARLPAMQTADFYLGYLLYTAASAKTKAAGADLSISLLRARYFLCFPILATKG